MVARKPKLPDEVLGCMDMRMLNKVIKRKSHNTPTVGNQPTEDVSAGAPRLDPAQCLAARGGEALRLPPYCEVPPGVCFARRRPGPGCAAPARRAGLCPLVGAERRGRRLGPQDEPLPGGSFKPGAEGLRAWGFTLGPTTVGSVCVDPAPGDLSAWRRRCSLVFGRPGGTSKTPSPWCLGVGRLKCGPPAEGRGPGDRPHLIICSLDVRGPATLWKGARSGRSRRVAAGGWTWARFRLGRPMLTGPGQKPRIP
ncbi:hypothetical protein NDU88_006600 [Pleurodeles waltl]|uniref:Uncharacterized protein n=1 Tax=Pleurodeles waltl TaxID=8319 RepID=A0AAV7MKE0_PLEWA|nr:hypothetical protein NDU88_006600 [Pleurodeles waltl]